jgi:hypothetical protein
MAARVTYAVSCTPIFTVIAGDNNPEVDTIGADVGKSLGSSGVVTTPGLAAQGYAAGVPAYKTTGIDPAVGTSLGTLSSIKFAFIKNTGFVYSSTSVLGAATTHKVTVCMNTTVSAATTLAVLNPGDSIVLPFNTATTPTLCVAPESTTAIAVEWYTTT